MTPIENDGESEIERQLAEFKRNNQLAKNNLSNVMERARSVSPKPSSTSDAVSGMLEGNKPIETMQM